MRTKAILILYDFFAKFLKDYYLRRSFEFRKTSQSTLSINIAIVLTELWGLFVESGSWFAFGVSGSLIKEGCSWCFGKFCLSSSLIFRVSIFTKTWDWLSILVRAWARDPIVWVVKASRFWCSIGNIWKFRDPGSWLWLMVGSRPRILSFWIQSQTSI